VHLGGVAKLGKNHGHWVDGFDLVGEQRNGLAKAGRSVVRSLLPCPFHLIILRQRKQV
jgi:hypothetical protein